ncbi:TAF6-like RNA polymerase II p300/CBP-associated factor-associated factor 65 kDa subunit 6L [Trichoplax sp. H2]|uniref:TATA box binding protein associated factor (TAF) histone-like fold domain-containing protein n=1 Tax=Trichoplax adhaerens TaxID=10228 RepID=B3RYW1_TRIAD|nr:hypothetical protein TRIADDRAFT_57235 [Trichoplax adhaerens]EDV23738.1 hypothetical protein TRIADDRAFT_57235 [Trichoplax adhaerens]RDD44308.1 TAF6-like RNA polymerase II p300/CBP-associated factor-associated factor 65 kDa subunit 6L [Trichoplax sp. H2]|eukprot:XP_002113264.1 hypothetical protein TRIADDRAFT_57235 [Trichoplax adhaerens]
MAAKGTNRDHKRRNNDVHNHKDGKERRFYRLSLSTMKQWADQLGFGEVNDEVAALLSEDASYRIRHLIQVASEVMIHSKRTRMMTDDVNKAAKLCRLESIYGINGTEADQFKCVTFKDSKIYYLDDKEVNLHNLIMNDEIPNDPGRTSVRAHWLPISGSLKQNSINWQQLNTANNTYLKAVLQGLKSQEPQLVLTIMNNLRTNSHVTVILPYVLYYLISSIKSHTHVARCLQSIQSIIENKSLTLLPYLVQLVSVLMTCTLDDHRMANSWHLRNKSAMLLALLAREYKKSSPNVCNNITNKLREVLASNDKPRFSHYGAIVTLTYFGGQELCMTLRAYFSRNWYVLNEMLENSAVELSIKYDILQVKSALQNAVCVVINDMEKYLQNEGNFSVGNIYHELYSYCGDSLAPVASHSLTNMESISSKSHTNRIFCQSWREKVKSFQPKILGL